MTDRASQLPLIGWREWVGLPDFGIRSIKAKIDSGARSSALHAVDLESFVRDDVQWVRFSIQPVQRSTADIATLEARVLESRFVRSSSGKATLRPVIETNVQLLGVVWPVELTLANRATMGFRMLLGRQAFRHRFLVDAGHSYYGGKPTRAKKKTP